MAFVGARKRSGKLKVDSKLINTLAEKAIQGGFTFDTRTGKKPASGYVVALQGSSIKPATNVDDAAAQIVDFFDDPNPRSHIVGGWFDKKNEEIVLDYVLLIDDEELAKEMGKLNNQQAIFHLDSGKEIDTGGTGDRKEAKSMPKSAETDSPVFIKRPDNWDSMSDDEKMDFAREAARAMGVPEETKE